MLDVIYNCSRDADATYEETLKILAVVEKVIKVHGEMSQGIDQTDEMIFTIWPPLIGAHNETHACEVQTSLPYYCPSFTFQIKVKWY